MERAGRIIARWRKTGDSEAMQEVAQAAWRVAAGQTVNRHTLGVSLVRTHLVVEVEDHTWRRQLFALRYQILASLKKVIGEGVVETLEFRVPAQRMGPGRETRNREPAAKPAARAEPVADEADDIKDPVLRLLYKKSRKRASA